MTQKSGTCPETAPAVDYELISGDTGRKIKIPQRKIANSAVVLPRWCFFLLLGLSTVGVIVGVILVSAVFAFVR